MVPVVAETKTARDEQRLEWGHILVIKHWWKIASWRNQLDLSVAADQVLRNFAAALGKALL